MNKDKFTLPLPMHGFAQPNSVTCWYACYAMMYAWQKKTALQLGQRLVAGGYKLDEIKSRGLKDSEYRKVAHAVGTCDVLRSSAVEWSLEDIIDRLQRWGPIYFSTLELGGGHAMVIYGVDTKLNNVIIADPYTLGGDYGSAHTEYFTLKKFRGTIQPVDYAIQVF